MRIIEGRDSVKKLILFGLVFLLALCFLGCGAPEKEAGGSTEDGSQETTDETTDNILMKVVDHFNAQGLQVTDVHEKNAELLGAVSGLGFDIAGGPAEIYLFDPETADADLVNNLEKVRTSELFLVGNREIPSIINGNIMLTGYEVGMMVHPEKGKLIEAFKSFSE